MKTWNANAILLYSVAALIILPILGYALSVNYDFYRVSTQGVEAPILQIEKKQNRGSRREIPLLFGCRVTYSFSAADGDHKATRNAPAKFCLEQASPQPPMVVYDPANPDRSFLRENLKREQLVLVFIDGIALLILLCIGWIYQKKE